MKEIQVDGVFSAPNLTDDEVNIALIELAESKGWSFGGGVKDITDEPESLMPFSDRDRKILGKK